MYDFDLTSVLVGFSAGGLLFVLLDWVCKAYAIRQREKAYTMRNVQHLEATVKGQRKAIKAYRQQVNNYRIELGYVKDPTPDADPNTIDELLDGITSSSVKAYPSKG